MAPSAAHPSQIPGPPRRRARLRTALVATLTTTVELVAAGMPASARTPASQTVDAPSRAETVELTDRTVVVSQRLAANQLISVSEDASVYKFKSATGALAKLRKGKVMLLSGLAAREITRVSTVKGRLVVRTIPAELTDVVQNGVISLDKPIDFTKGLVLSGDAVPPQARIGVDRPLTERFGLQPLARRGSTKVSGKLDGYEWEATFTPTTTGLTVEVTITRPSPVELAVTISGTLDNLNSGGSIQVQNGQLSQAQMTADNLKGAFTLKYAAKPISALGLGQAGGYKVELPAEIVVPFAVGGVPFFLGVRVAFFAAAGFSSFDQELSGEYTMQYDGSGGITASSSGATSPTGVLDGLASIVLNAVNAVNKGPLSFVFGAQMPQLELGMGVKGFNVAGNVTLVGTTQIATFGGGCDTRKMQIIGTSGANATFFGLSSAFGTQKLFDHTIQAAYPAGCGVAP